MGKLVTLLLLLMGAHVSPALAACCLDVTMDVSVQGDSGRPALKVSLRNNESAPIEINKSLLPWGGRYSIILVAVREKSPNEPLAQKFFIDDLGPETVELTPGQAAQGIVDMREFFQDLQGELKRGNLIVLWSYKVVAVDGSESKRLAGWVQVPRIQ